MPLIDLTALARRADALLSDWLPDSGATATTNAIPASIRYLTREQRQAVASVGLGRRIVHAPASLATAKGWDARSGDERGLAASVDADLHVRAVMRDALALARQDGVAWVMMVSEGTADLSQPRPDGAPVVRLHVLSYSEAMPIVWDADPLSPYFTQPRAFTVHLSRDSVAVSLGTVHRSHLIRVCGLTIDPTQRSPSDRPGADISAIEAYWGALADYDLTGGSLARLAQMISIPWIKLGNLAAQQSGVTPGDGRPGPRDILARLRRAMGVYGLTTLGSDGEMGVLSPSLAGVRDLSASQYERLAGVEGAPPEFWFGFRVGGLGTSDDQSREAVRSFVGSVQDEALAPALAELYAATLGPDPDRVIVFAPLDEPSEAEAATVALTRTQAAVARITAGITAPDEERAILAGDGPSDIAIDPDAGAPMPEPGLDLAPLAEDPARADAEDDTRTPPAAVREAARRALEVRASKPPSQRGMTATGIARARDLANGRPVSVATLRRMRAYFDRHEVDKQGSTWSEKGKGWQAWHGWGGDAGRGWANRMLRPIEGEK